MILVHRRYRQVVQTLEQQQKVASVEYQVSFLPLSSLGVTLFMFMGKRCIDSLPFY